MQKTEITIETKLNEIFAKTNVTYKILNNTSSPIELKIYIQNFLDKILFSSFYAKIGNTSGLRSKVIKIERKKENYNDRITSENAVIYAEKDGLDTNKIIVYIGNLPPYEELIFIAEFIQFIESNDNKNFEYELFRNLPHLKSKNIKISGYEVKGILEINTKNKIKNINKNLSKNLKINEEKEDKNNNKFYIKYQYISNEVYNKKKENNIFKLFDTFFIPSSKIFFEIESNNSSFLFSQIFPKYKEKSYILNYYFSQNNNIISNNKEIKFFPALFIFLIDQSGSMGGSRMKIASKILCLFLQSLPANSYYQIIGFGYNPKKYDEIPKENNQKNIEESLKIIQTLKAEKGGMEIYEPLEKIYTSKCYDEINLPKNIFLLTDGEMKYKKETLDLIEYNSNKFSVYSFGIGNDFDEDFIKKAALVGKGNYSFCKNINQLNQIIASNINDICVSNIKNFKIISSLEENNLYKLNETPKVIKENNIIKLGYIKNFSEEENKKFNFNEEELKHHYKKEIKENIIKINKNLQII